MVHKTYTLPEFYAVKLILEKQDSFNSGYLAYPKDCEFKSH